MITVGKFNGIPEMRPPYNEHPQQDRKSKIYPTPGGNARS